jgi:hypothetical protein
MSMALWPCAQASDLHLAGRAAELNKFFFGTTKQVHSWFVNTDSAPKNNKLFPLIPCTCWLLIWACIGYTLLKMEAEVLQDNHYTEKGQTISLSLRYY